MTYVYLLSMNGISPVKIGITEDLQGRVKSIQTGNPHAIKCEYALSVDDREQALHVERAVHRALSDNRMNGEWFNVSVDEAREILSKYSNVNQFDPSSIRVNDVNDPNVRLAAASLLASSIQIAEVLAMGQLSCGHIPEWAVWFHGDGPIVESLADAWWKKTNIEIKAVYWNVTSLEHWGNPVRMLQWVINSTLRLDLEVDWCCVPPDGAKELRWQLLSGDEVFDEDGYRYPDTSNIRDRIEHGKRLLAHIQRTSTQDGAT